MQDEPSVMSTSSVPMKCDTRHLPEIRGASWWDLPGNRGMPIIGWDDDKKVFSMRNKWKSDWETIPWGDVPVSPFVDIKHLAPSLATQKQSEESIRFGLECWKRFSNVDPNSRDKRSAEELMSPPKRLMLMPSAENPA